MQTIQLSGNDMYALEHIFLGQNYHISVKSLEHFLKINITNSRKIRFCDMYDPSDFIEFDFIRQSVQTSRSPGVCVYWGSPLYTGTYPTEKEIDEMFKSKIKNLNIKQKLEKCRMDEMYMDVETLRPLRKNAKTLKNYYFYNNGLAVQK